MTLIALLCNALTKAPSRSFNQVTKRLRLTLEGRLKQFQLTDLSLHTLIWKNQFKLHNPDPEDDRRSLKQNIHPFRSQARLTFLYHGVPDRAVKSNCHIVTSLCLRGEWCSGRDLRDIEVFVSVSRDQLIGLKKVCNTLQNPGIGLIPDLPAANIIREGRPGYAQVHSTYSTA